MKKLLRANFWSHLFWMLGKLYISALTLDFKDMVDIYYWILIHLAYEGNQVGSIPQPTLIQIKNGAIELFGFVVTIFFLVVTAKALLILF